MPPLSQDKACFYLDLLFCVIQTVEPVRECVCSVWIQTWGLSVPRSLSERKWRNVLLCDKWCVSKARYSVKEQWRWHCTLSYQTRLFKSHTIESSLLVNRIFCQLPDRRGLQLEISSPRFVWKCLVRVCESKSDIFFIPEWSLRRCLNSRLCHWRWLNRIVSLSVDLLLQMLLWPLLLGLYGSAAVAIFGGSGRLWSHLCMRCRLTVLILF